jgi:hypothetical protein
LPAYWTQKPYKDDVVASKDISALQMQSTLNEETSATIPWIQYQVPQTHWKLRLQMVLQL